MGQITATRNLVATKIVRIAGQKAHMQSLESIEWKLFQLIPGNLKFDPFSALRVAKCLALGWKSNYFLILTKQLHTQKFDVNWMKAFLYNAKKPQITDGWTDVNSLRPSDAYMHQQTRLSFVQKTACRVIGTKPLFEPMLGYCLEQTSGKFYSKFIHFHSRKSIWKCCLENGGHFVLASMC